MCKKLLFLIVLIVSVSTVFSQESVKGFVQDQEGNPLVGVIVYLHQSKTGTLSEVDGSYEIAIPANLSSLIVEYSYIGYKSESKTIDLTANSLDEIHQLNITLQKSPFELQEIVVSTGFITEQDEVSYPISAVSKNEITSSGAINLARTIANTPGVYNTTFGLGGGQPVIRGLTNTNLVTLNNGIKQEAFQFSSNHPFLIDEYAASHIEIIKGPASLQYGSDAVGGVVNVVRERPAKSNSIEGDFVSQYHTNTNGYLNTLGLKGSKGKIFFSGRGSLKSHKDFTDGSDNVVNNTRLNEGNFSLNTGIRSNRGIFTLNYNYTNAEYGIQNQPQLNLFANPLSETLLTQDRKNEVWYQDLKNNLFSSNNTLYFNDNSLDIDLGYQTNTRELVAGGINPQNQLVAPMVVAMDLTTLTYNTKFNMDAGDHNLIFGLNGAIVENKADESKPNIPMPDTKMNDLGVYAIGDFDLSDDLVLTSGLRYDYRNMKSFPTETTNTNRFEVDNDYSSLNGSLGATYNFKENQFLKANLSRGFRSPNVPELTQNGIHGGRFERGNPDLDAQSNYQIDFTYHLHTDWAIVNVSPFYNTINNYLYLVMTNEDAPIGGGKIFQHVQNDANLWGNEIALDIHPADWIGIHGSHSMVRADIKNDTSGVEHPTFTPQDRLTGEIRLYKEQLGVVKQPQLSLEVLNFFKQDRTGQNEAVTPAYTLLNAKIGATLPVGKQNLNLFIKGSNLANETYFDHLSVTKPLGLNRMGRNVMFGLHLPLDFEIKK